MSPLSAAVLEFPACSIRSALQLITASPSKERIFVIHGATCFDPAADAADGKLFLNYVGEGPGGDHHTGDKPIAENIILKSGSLDISVPDVKSGEQYTLTLFTGDQAITKPSSPFSITQK